MVSSSDNSATSELLNSFAVATFNVKEEELLSSCITREKRCQSAKKILAQHSFIISCSPPQASSTFWSSIIPEDERAAAAQGAQEPQDDVLPIRSSRLQQINYQALEVYSSVGKKGKAKLKPTATSV